MKLCPTCGEKPRYTPPNGRCTGYCKECWSTRAKEWNKKNKQRVRHNQLKLKFGISLAEYEAMEKAQEGLCAICKEKDPSGRALAVDHSHLTGKNRALLCVRCNIGLGDFRESPAILQRAIEYLARHN